MNEKNEKIMATVASVVGLGFALYRAYKTASGKGGGNDYKADGVERYPDTKPESVSGPRVDPNIMLNMALRHMGRMTDITNSGFNR